MSIIRDVAIVALFVWLSLDHWAVTYRRRTSKVENRDRYSQALLMIGGMIVAGILVGTNLMFSTLGRISSGVPLQVVGLVIMAVGIAVRVTAIRQLGRFHTPNVAILAGHQLMDTGLYRYIRHPSYLGALIGLLGFSLALGNWFSLIVIMGILPLFYLIRIHEEETALADALGDRYRAYCRRTRRLIPGVY
ncbi:MAG: methyltransferase family protein [Vulcanimicrobiaceae bacterium]